MQKSHECGQVVRFGVFEVDLRAGELRKNGVKIKLQEQPFQILAMLLERPGEIVTREELQQKLWSNDTFVDFDNSLNKAINKIREALGDSADNPRFVETMARRGYRFIAPVDGFSAAVSIPESSVRADASQRPRMLTMAIPAGVVVLIAGFGLTWWLMRPSSPPVRKRALTRLTADTGLTTHPALSPDGKLLAYASDRSGEGNLDIWLKQVAGGEPLRLTRHKADDLQPSFSPDGSQIAFRSEREGGGIYVMSSLGGDERFIARKGLNPRFSPDGRWILYGNGYDKIYVVPSSGGAPRQLGSDFHVALSPTWAPDGKHFLFSGTRSTRDLDEYFQDYGDWWVAPLDGGPAVKTGAFEKLKGAGLSTTNADVWSWHGDQLIFAAQVPYIAADNANIWQIPISAKTWQVTEDPQQLTFGTGLEGHPSVTADGQLVFSSVTENPDVWSLPLEANKGKVSGEMQRLTQNAGWDGAFDLSADGRKLLFWSDRSGWSVWLKDLESGKEGAIITVPPGSKGWPGWPKMTPDGSKISYGLYGRGESEKDAIYVVPANGGVPEKVCEDCAGPYHWSPNGKTFLYRIPPDRKESIGLFSLKSGKKTELLRHPSNPLGLGNCQFSPDNRWIAFQVPGDHPSGDRLFVVRFRGEEELRESEWIAVTERTMNARNDWPHWSPDGNLLYFSSDRDGFNCIWAQRLEPATKHPFGSAFAVSHFHRAQFRLAGEAFVACGKIVFTLVEWTGNIWMSSQKQ